MKILNYWMLLMAAFAFVSCGDGDGDSGSGDATVGFESPSYTYMESAGTIRIPVKFTGTPKKYPIVFSVSASLDDGVKMEEVAGFVQDLSSLRYNGKGGVSIEIELKDNFTTNPTRVLTLEIVSADGAAIVDGRTVISIEDNDGAIFEALQGKWTFHSTVESTGGTKTFDILIDAGGDEREIAENTAAQRLRFFGWDGYTYDSDGVPFVQYADIKTDPTSGGQYLEFDPTVPLIESAYDVLKVGVKPTIIRMYWAPDETPKEVYPETRMKAAWSEDLQTITFNQDWSLVPLIYSTQGFTNGKWDQHFDITLTR